MKPTTKQILNFIHNTLGITKEEFKLAALEGAKEEGRTQAKRTLQQDSSYDLAEAIKKGVREILNTDNVFYNRALHNELIKEIAKQLTEKLLVISK